MVLAALTGNFGMGKSYVLSVFRALGAAILDSDRVVAGLLEQEKVIRRMKGLLGDGVLDQEGQLNKKAVAEKIFSDRSLKKSVEAYLHPLVLREVDEFVSRLRGKKSVVVIEVPLLFEGGYRDKFQKVITVHTTRENALKRLRISGISRREAQARMKTQLPVRIKKKHSDFTIDNNGTRWETTRQVRRIYRELMKDAGIPPPGTAGKKTVGRAAHARRCSRASC